MAREHSFQIQLKTFLCTSLNVTRRWKRDVMYKFTGMCITEEEEEGSVEDVEGSFVKTGRSNTGWISIIIQHFKEFFKSK